MLDFIDDWKIPDDYLSSGGGHVHLAFLQHNMKDAIDTTLIYLENQKRIQKVQDGSDGFSDSGPYREITLLDYDEFENDDIEVEDEDLDDINAPKDYFDEGVTGVARSSLSNSEVRSFLDIIAKENFCWDLGCQMLAYKQLKHDRKSYTLRCYCPFGVQHRAWKDSNQKIKDIITNNEIPPCHKAVFETPFDLWQHCRNKGKDCIIHFGLQKYLENTYKTLVTKNSLVSYLNTLKCFEIIR